MSRKLFTYSIIIAASALIFGLLGGHAIRPDRILLVVALIPIFAFAIWLRWDWAPRERARRSERRKP